MTDLNKLFGLKGAEGRDSWEDKDDEKKQDAEPDKGKDTSCDFSECSDDELMEILKDSAYGGERSLDDDKIEEFIDELKKRGIYSDDGEENKDGGDTDGDGK